MGLLEEDDVYIGTKAFFGRRDWKILGGQPPKGTDHIPVVEIKSPRRDGIGSSRAYKPDLITTNGELFLLIECKPDHSKSDAVKLRSILSDRSRVELLFDELRQRRLLEKFQIKTEFAAFRRGLHGVIAHSGTPETEPDLIVLVIYDVLGNGRVVLPASMHPEMARGLS